MGDLYLPLHNPDIKEGGTLNGDPLASLNDLADLRRFLLDVMGSRIQELVFNNGSIVTGGGTENVTPVTLLTGKIALYMKELRFTYNDTYFPAGGTGFMAPQTMDLTDWTMGGIAVVPADVKDAAFTRSVIRFRWSLTTRGILDIQAKILLQPDLVSWVVKFDYQIWKAKPASYTLAHQDPEVLFLEAPDVSVTDAGQLQTVFADVTAKTGADGSYLPAYVDLATNYFAMGIKE